MSSPTSENYDGAVPRGHGRRRALLGTAPVLPPREAHPMHGIGAQTRLRYCQCGAKKRNGLCIRGCDKDQT